MDAAGLAPFALLALLGAAHCAGMCGGLALLATGGSESGGRRALTVALFVAGKCTTYAVLGAAVALATHSAAHAGAPEDFESTRALIALVAGALLLVSGVAWLVRPKLAGGAVSRGVARVFGGATRALGALSPPWRAFGIGLTSGLLPCGLTLGALALAAQVSPGEAVLGMLAFGVATSPALAAVATAASWAPRGLRRLGARLVGPALIALGLFVGLRGALPLASPGSTCCEPATGLHRAP